MNITYAQALKKLNEWTHGKSLLRHARSVEIVMRAAAVRYGGENIDVDAWGICGLLHDADYEAFPTEHPQRIVQWLNEMGEPLLAHATAAHYTKWGVSHDTMLDKALLACDELTGFVVACCQVRPEGIKTLTPKSVLKKFNDRSFAAKVDRGEVLTGCEMLGVELTNHIELIIDSLKPHAAELGIAARVSGS